MNKEDFEIFKYGLELTQTQIRDNFWFIVCSYILGMINLGVLMWVILK